MRGALEQDVGGVFALGRDPVVAVHEVVIQKQALAACGSHERLALLRAEGKRAAGLQNGEDTDQPVFDVITLGDLPRKFLFPSPSPGDTETAVLLSGPNPRHAASPGPRAPEETVSIPGSGYWSC